MCEKKNLKVFIFVSIPARRTRKIKRKEQESFTFVPNKTTQMYL